ncbi:MAG: TerB N-terminal domain-containing protein [Gammaproteobacteria bacterium]|nr:TerB N-terminal domain-containing protein [Gammaproteobacteria bacterium]
MLASFLFGSHTDNRRRPSQGRAGNRQNRNDLRPRGNPRTINREAPKFSTGGTAKSAPSVRPQSPSSPFPSHAQPAPLRSPAVDRSREGKVKQVERTDGWIPKDGNARVGGRNIGGMVYVGKGPRMRRDRRPEDGYIDLSLEVGSRSGDYDGHGLHYWSNYSTIDSRSRATYLDWLSSGRSDTRYDVGYVFLYFYGLERRVFVDGTDSQERGEIVDEVRRLLDIYGHNHSVRRYLGAFIDATSVLDSNSAIKPVFEHDGYEVPVNVLLALGRMAAKGEPLTGEWLLSWYLCHPETRLRTPAKRAFAEFKEYFQYLFVQKYPDGFKLHASKRRLKFMYHAASGNFAVDLIANLGEIPDVSRLSRPLNAARGIAYKATEGLDKYSRYLGRNPEGRGTIEAHALLPEAIWSVFPCPEKEQLLTWVKDQMGAGGLVPVEDVIERLEGNRPEKVGKRQLVGVADALARLGVGMAPDPRFALRQPRLGEPVVLFNLPEDIVTIENPGEGYRNAIVSLAIGTLVAHSDGRIDTSEREHLAGEIDANRSVSEAERSRLHANLTWMAAVPPDMGMLRSRLKTATESARSALGQLAVAAASADGMIDPDEIRMIEKLYTTMGLERERVYADLHALTSAAEPITVRRADLAPGEFTIPSPPDEVGGGTVTLDAARVSAGMADTVRVSQVLGDIFADGEADDEADDEEILDDTEPDSDKRFGGLDAPHRAVAAVLITRHQWTEEEIAGLADEHQLMVDGALETINEWAFENLGDALIEQYDGYEVNGALAQELMH